MAVKHAKHSDKLDAADETLIRPVDWNADHTTEGAVEIVIDGAGVAITSGIKADIILPFAGHFTSWTLLADVTGSIIVDLWRDTYSNFPPTVADAITGSEHPTLTSGTSSTGSTLAGWTTGFAKGDVLRVNVDSATSVTRVTLTLAVVEP